MGDYGKGMEMGVEAATIAGNMGDARRIATAELHIGDVHYRSGNYTRALNTLEPLIETYKVLGDTLQAGKVEANAALNYYALWGKDPDTYRGYKDTTIHQLLRARSTICTHGTPQDRLIVDQLLGGLYAAEGRPEQGLPYNEQSLEIILASRDSLKYAPAYGNLAYNYQELDRFDEALILYDSALYYSRLFEQDATIHILLEDMSKGYQKVGDYENALTYYKEYHDVRASTLNEKTLNRIAELEVQHETEYQRLALETSEQKVLTLEKEAQLRSNRMLLIAGGLLFSLLVGVLIYMQWREDARHREVKEKLIAAELANERLASGKLTTRLENQREDLTDFALDIERKNRFSKELSDRLYALKKNLPSNSHSRLEAVIRFVQDHDKLNEHMETVQENIDQVNSEFHQKMRSMFPKLTTSDRELAGMLRLNMTNKEVATNRGISTASAKMARYRLRKKLGLKPSDDINAFLREI